ncbi:MAG: VWA domain-containing protein, partial [Nitrospirota bacterium]
EPRGALAGDALVPGAPPALVVEQLLAVGDDRRGRREVNRSEDRAFLYDEWDGLIQDYRSRWCRVVERVAPEGTADFAEATLAAHGPAVRLLRRYFESIRPPSLRRVPGQTDGEDLDLDALIRRTADRLAGAEPSDRIYVRREKRERQVAAVFLVDLSGSTSRQIESQTGFDVRRVIDVEKEGLVLLCEALDAIGDQYAVYGYSGQGRNRVDFVVLKEFDEPAGGRAAYRIGAVTPLHQNRDGAAIRHAAHKLLSRNARVRLLVLISDGRPLDDGYADEYSLEDTKMALREARMRGIDPFCITVDRDAGDYLRRMYGDVRFLIIDRAEALPERLPRVYHRLTRS